MFGRIGSLPRFGASDQAGPTGNPALVAGEAFIYPIGNYYQTDPISRASPTMVACTETLLAPALAAAE